MTAIAPNAAVAPTPWTGEGVLTHLDAESMIVYCQSQLTEVDTQVAALTREQELAVARKKAVQSVQAAYDAVATGQADATALAKAYSDAIESLPPGDATRQALDEARAAEGLCFYPPEEVEAAVQQAVNEAYAEATANIEAHPESFSDPNRSVEQARINGYLTNRCVGAEKRVRAEMTPRTPTKEQCDAAVERLRSLTDQVGGDAEINMIRLQSLVSARQTMVGLVTNILSKIQAGEKAIVDNIR